MSTAPKDVNDNILDDNNNNNNDEESPYSLRPPPVSCYEERETQDQFREWIAFISDPRNNLVKELQTKFGHCLPTCVGNKNTEDDIKPLDNTDNNSNEKDGFIVEVIELGSRRKVRREVFYKSGVRHGFYREIDGTRGFLCTGIFLYGRKAGVHWKRLQGEGFYVGNVNDQGDASDTHGVYLYPDLATVLHGTFLDGNLVEGKRGKLTGFHLSTGIPVPRVSSSSAVLFHFSPSSASQICARPLLMDPYEAKHVYVGVSTVPEGGEGLYAKVDLKPGQIAAFFNGVRAAADQETYSEYRINMNKEDALDIRSQEESLDKYRATLGHKACHSFTPNARFVAAFHPQYGRIMAVATLSRGVKAGEEIMVRYNYDVEVAPIWYQQAWANHCAKLVQ